MSDVYDFQKDLEKSIFGADEKLNKKELLVDIFKMYVAKLFEMKLKDSRLSEGILIAVKANLISEFRKAALAEYQMSIEQYEELFDKTVQEILQSAALAHQGQDMVQMDPMQELLINTKNMKMSESGLLIPR